MRRVLTAGLLVLVLSLTLVSAGCGGDDEPEASPTAEWVDAFCTAVTDWTNELEQIGGTLTSLLTTEALEEAADDVSTATDDFVEEVRGLGAPDTDSGQAIEDAVQDLADVAEAEKANVEEAVEEASGATGVAGAISTIGTSLSAMATAFQTTFQAFDDADVDGELETAFEESAACDEISG